MAGGQKGIYVRESDMPLWEACEALAKRRRVPMSAAIMLALADWYEKETGRKPPGSGESDHK